MASTSKKDVKSPQEIEEEVKSIPTVTWDPFTVFPKKIYVEIFDKLDSATDKQNFMNAHVKWYELFESKRTLFLFEEVLKEIVKKDDKEVRFGSDWKRAFRNYQHCRLVCPGWNHGAQNFFQFYGNYFKIKGEERTFGERCGCEPRNFFYWYTAWEAEEDLEMFSATHPPSKNPFFSRRVTLLSVSDAGKLHAMGDRVDGRILVAFYDEAGDFVPIEEEVNEENWREFEEDEHIERYRTSVSAILDRYGRHFWHCKIEIEEEMNPEACLVIAKWLDLMPELKTLELIHPSRRCLNHQVSHKLDLEIEDMQLVPPELKNLIFLKTYRLPPIVFNKLFGNLAPEKVQIEAGVRAVLKNFELERRNLKEAFLTLKGFDDYKNLEESEPFPNLKKLVIALYFEKYEEGVNKVYSKFFEWKMIFEILERKCPALEELTLRLPEAVSEEDKQTVIDQSLKCQLNLPKLKKLWISLPNLCSLDFIYPCKGLEELRVIRGRSGWALQKSIGLRTIRWGKSIIFSMGLKNMCESSIWKAFPKLRLLKITDGR